MSFVNGHKRKVPLITVLGLTAIILSSCHFPVELWVVSGSTADGLVFGFSESRKSKRKIKTLSIKVFPCVSVRKQPGGSYFPSDEFAVWSASVPAGTVYVATNRIMYGRDEFGLKTQRGPEGLTAHGCYVAIADAAEEYDGGVTAFKIDEDRKVVELRGKEYEAIFRK